MHKHVNAPERTIGIGKPLTWLTRALNLRSADIPLDLSLRPVLPTMDMAQDGWGLATFAYHFDTISTSPGGKTRSDIVVPSQDTQVVTRLFALQTIIDAGPVPITCALVLYTGKAAIPTSGAYEAVVIAKFDVPIADTVGFGISWKDIAGRADAMLTIPPGWGLAIIGNFPAAPPAWAVKWTAEIATIPGQQRGGR